jgi:hypothetical protein
MKSIAGWLARGIALRRVVELTVSSFTPPLSGLAVSVRARDSHGKVEGQGLFAYIFVEAPSTVPTFFLIPICMVLCSIQQQSGRLGKTTTVTVILPRTDSEYELQTTGSPP